MIKHLALLVTTLLFSGVSSSQKVGVELHYCEGKIVESAVASAMSCNFPVITNQLNDRWILAYWSRDASCYVDIRGATKENGFLKRWTMCSMKEPHTMSDNVKYFSTVALLYVDCENSLAVMQNISAYSDRFGAGYVVLQGEDGKLDPSKLQTPRIGSITENLAQITCMK
jgi:hypothetical protein